MYGSPSDFINHVNFTHDINPGNGPAVSSVDSGNGFGARVFWVAVIPDSDVQVSPGSGRAEMHVRNLPELDYYSPEGTGDLASLGPTWQTDYFESTVSLDVVWSGPITRRVNVKDAANGFAGTFFENQATVTWSAQSESGFSFVSDVGSFATSVPEVPGVNGVTVPLNFFAQVGEERNGIFFPGGSSAASAASASALAVLDPTLAGQVLPAVPQAAPASPLPPAASYAAVAPASLADASSSSAGISQSLATTALAHAVRDRAFELGPALFEDTAHSADVFAG